MHFRSSGTRGQFSKLSGNEDEHLKFEELFARDKKSAEGMEV